MAPLWVFDDGILSGFDDVDDLIVPYVDRHLGRPPRHPSALKRESSDGSLPPIYPRRQPHQQQQRHGVSSLPPLPSSILRTHGRRLSTSLGPQNKRRKVSIQDSYRVRDVESRHDYSSQERKACWYDKAELRSMKEEANDDAQLMERGLLSDDEHICLRGLECRTQLGARRRKDNRSNAYAAVFFELDSQQLQHQQHEQKQQQDSDYDDRAVADAYSSYSESCQFAAYMRGLRDAAAVERQETNPSPTPSIPSPKPQQQHQPQHHLFFQQGMMSLSCYGLMDLSSSSPSSSSAAGSTSSSSSSSLPNVSLPSSYWEALISSAA